MCTPTDCAFMTSPRPALRLATRRVGGAYAIRALPAALCQPRIPKDRKERRASAVRERIVAGLAIVDDESLDRHGLHCVRGDANGGRADAGCGAEQDHALLCGERRRPLCHGYSRRQLFANALMAASCNRKRPPMAASW